MNLKSACLLLILCHAGSAAALGLGELTVRSHLGQALHVTVKILEPGEAADTSCFSVAPGEGAAVSPPRTQLSLERNDNQALLHIRTAYAINDPITQFKLISDCESRLRREYVVLLDPPASVAPALSQAAPTVAARERVLRAKPTPSASRSASKQRIKRTSTTPSPSSLTTRTLAARSQSRQEDPAPRLVLSGRHGVNNAAFALRFDDNLPDLDRPRSEGLTPDELSDENTALTRKLAHLEEQLVALQKRNAEIESQRTGAPVNHTVAPAKKQPSPAKQATQWPLSLLVAGLLGVAGLLVVWLRRLGHTTWGRGTGTGTGTAHSLPETPLFSPESMTPPDPWTEPVLDHEDPLPESKRILEFVPPSPAQTTEVKDDILDQAEVYMAHGHGNLAIHLLQEHLRAAPDESPVPWLLLLDLLHREGNTAGYATASAECRRYFNINLSSYPALQDAETSHGLEDYPHLLEQLVAAWGTPQIEDLIHELIYDSRGGTRVGFAPATYRDILLLRDISQAIQPSVA